MSTLAIPLWPGRPPASSPKDDFEPHLVPHLLGGEAPAGAVLICPGGGYAHRAPHEGGAIAERFNAAGFHAFVVQYRVAPHRHPAPLLDASRALRLIRRRAGEWNVSPPHVAVCGFSAGGHLACGLGVFHAAPELHTGDELDSENARPDASILCYPVILGIGPFAHAGSMRNLLGFRASEAERQGMSLERFVTETTPPAFLWHTAEDPGVPVENSLLLAQALSRNKVPFELHVYPKGQHGLGLAGDSPHVATWMPLCCEWLSSVLHFPAAPTAAKRGGE